MWQSFRHPLNYVPEAQFEYRTVDIKSNGNAPPPRQDERMNMLLQRCIGPQWSLADLSFCAAYVRFWHKADITAVLIYVRFWG